MKPATAAAIARRIAIDETQDGSFVDDCRIERYVIPPEGLYEYLLTGDRPLRVMESFLSADGSFEIVRGEGVCEAIWRPASRFGVPTQGEGDTPAAAILSCAAALEEGHE